MRKRYDRDEMFRMVSESYELGLSAANYCRTKNFPTKVFYRYREQYIKLYGAATMPYSSNLGTFIPLATSTPLECSGLILEVGTHIRLHFDSLPSAHYLSDLLKNLPYASSK